MERGDDRYRLSLLGPFALFGPGGSRVELSSRKGMALLALLATAPGGERTRAWLQEQLWGSRGEAQAQASLRRELANLRATIDAGARLPILSASRDRVRLDLDRIDIDIRSPDWVGKQASGLAFLEGLDIAGEDGFEDWLRVQRRHFAERAEAHADDRQQSLSQQDPRTPAASLAKIRLAVVGRWSGGGDVLAFEQCIEDIRAALGMLQTIEVAVPWQPVDDRPIRADPLTACAKLAIDYLAQASIRMVDDRLHVTLTLTECAARRQVWADTIVAAEGTAGRFAAMAAARINSAIEREAMQRATDEAASSAEPVNLFFQADAMFRRWDRESMERAVAIVEKVIATDPTNPKATALAAFCHGACYGARWTNDVMRSRALALELCDRSMREGGDDPLVLGYGAGTLISVGGDMAFADRLVTRAIELQPDSVSALFWGGWVDLVSSNAGRARERFETVLDINPRSNARPFALTGLGLCLIGLQRPADAVLILTESTQRLPTYAPGLAGLAAAFWLTGRADEARQAQRKLAEAGGLGLVTDMLQHSDLSRLLVATIEPEQPSRPVAAGERLVMQSRL